MKHFVGLFLLCLIGKSLNGALSLEEKENYTITPDSNAEDFATKSFTDQGDFSLGNDCEKGRYFSGCYFGNSENSIYYFIPLFIDLFSIYIQKFQA